MSQFMHIYGVVCEYNPFHNGHAYHLSQVRAKATHVVAVMSGSFVQRGEPALLDKWTRARMALCHGADLVLELPLPWSMARAERFAQGAVSALAAMGCVEGIAFGCETADGPALLQTAKALRSPTLIPALKRFLGEGLPFAAARERAVRLCFGDACANLLTRPNDLLAVEYTKAILALDAPFSLLAVPRLGAGHDAPLTGSGPVASASALRGEIWKGVDVSPFVPPGCQTALREAALQGRLSRGMDPLLRALLLRLRTMTEREASALPDMTEGMHRRLLAAARAAGSLDALYDAAKTKRYSHARIRRAAAAALLGLTEQDGEDAPPYLRVLGLNPRGRELLRTARTSSSLPLLMRPSQLASLPAPARRVFSLECAATDAWALTTETILPAGLDYTTPVVTVGL